MKTFMRVALAVLIIAGSMGERAVEAEIQAAESITVFRDDNGNYTAETDTLGVNVTNTPEGTAAIYSAANSAGEGLAIDETQHGMGLAGGSTGVKAGETTAAATTDATTTAATDTAAADAKSNKICGLSSSEASAQASDSAGLTTLMEAKGMKNPSAACLAAMKDGLNACAKGDSAAAKTAMTKADEACPEVTEETKTGSAVNTPTPVSVAAKVQNATTTVQQTLQQAQNTLKTSLTNLLGGKSSLGSSLLTSAMQGVVNGVAQQMVTQALSALTGTSSSSSSDSSTTSTDTTSSTITCDTVTATNQDTKTEVVSEVSVTTVLTIDSCANGHIRTRSAITMVYPDGTTQTKNSEAIQ